MNAITFQKFNLVFKPPIPNYLLTINGFTMSKKILQCILVLSAFILLSGCIAATVVSTAVGVTTTVVGGAIDVVDAVTPDIIDDDDDEEEDEEKEKDKSEDE